MADTQTASLNVTAAINRKTPLDLGDVLSNMSKAFNVEMANGTSASQVDKTWGDTRTVASGADDDIDLRALTETILGSTITTTLAKLRYLFIWNETATTGDYLFIDASVTNAFTGMFVGVTTGKDPIGPASPFVKANIVDGWTVDGTHKVLRIHNAGTHTITYHILIAGTSA